MSTDSREVPIAGHRLFGKNLLNKVPEVTIYFWIIKILCTTVGETGADNLSSRYNLSDATLAYYTGAILVAVLVFVFAFKKYIPLFYWAGIVLISVVGTLITDNLVDNHGVALHTTTIIFSIATLASFAIWYGVERTLSIHSIVTLRREVFYWVTVLFTFALGTAAGDYIAETSGLGYWKSIILFGGSIAVITVAHLKFGLNAIFAFWAAYVLTRPLGASIGDYMSQAKADGGLAPGTNTTSYIFLGTILALVVYLSITRVDQTPPEAEAPAV
ncbi:hypothetical protein NBH00_08715 [Paraconexibacter antarcticus]|uniref:Membrane-anchored protein n=1 Tax=Paraconexibacter antarcticus TaxID=2949664 RepID=A0ABY5DW76_9ACTN|nr:hypothetical protein [Paraconexibacter antarcticus]UTI66273.1 hypothetical protein NBH00_08715 [Paraconexibacter antarcticus]